MPMPTLKPQSSVHYTAIRWLVHCCWWVGCYIWYSEEGPGRAGALPSPLLAVYIPNVTAHLSTASVPTSFTWHYCLWTLKG